MRKFIYWSIPQILLAVVFIFFYKHLVISDFKEYSLKKRNLTTGDLAIDIPDSGTYLLKIWCRGTPSEVTFNDVTLAHSLYRPRAKLNEFYYVINEGLLKSKRNILHARVPYNYSMLLKNNLMLTDFGAVLIKSPSESPKRLPSCPGIIFFAGFLLYGWAFRIFLSGIFMRLTEGTLLSLYCVSFLPAGVKLYLCFLISRYSPLNLIFFDIGFFGLLFVSIMFTQFFILLVWSFLSFSRWIKDKPFREDARVILKTKNLNVSQSKKIEQKNRKQLRTKNHQLEDHKIVRWWLQKKMADRFFILFTFFLANSTFCLMVHLNFFAEIFANITFFMLVIGVFVKLTEFHETDAK